MEIRVLVNRILQSYNNFSMVNEKRAQAFYNQIRADCFELYSKKMHNIFDNEESIFADADLLTIHKATMDESVALVCSIFQF